MIHSQMLVLNRVIDAMTRWQLGGWLHYPMNGQYYSSNIVSCPSGMGKYNLQYGVPSVVEPTIVEDARYIDDPEAVEDKNLNELDTGGCSTALIAQEADAPVDEDTELLVNLAEVEGEHDAGSKTVTQVYTELVREQALSMSEFLEGINKSEVKEKRNLKYFLFDEISFILDFILFLGLFISFALNLLIFHTKFAFVAPA